MGESEGGKDLVGGLPACCTTQVLTLTLNTSRSLSFNWGALRASWLQTHGGNQSQIGLVELAPLRVRKIVFILHGVHFLAAWLFIVACHLLQSTLFILTALVASGGSCGNDAHQRTAGAGGGKRVHHQQQRTVTGAPHADPAFLILAVLRVGLRA